MARKALNSVQSAALAGFDELPESAFVDVHVYAAVKGCSPSQVWRNVRDGKAARPRKLGPQTTRFQVGEIRRELAALRRITGDDKETPTGRGRRPDGRWWCSAGKRTPPA